MRVFARSDIGKERTKNEDHYYVSDNPKLKLFIVADGMGGYNGGEVASEIAVNSVKEYITGNFDKFKNSKEDIKIMIKNAIEYANSAIYERAKRVKDLKGMGTTIDVCLIYYNTMYVGHVGDSRVYRIRKKFLRKITKDHSYVQQLIEDGTITKEEAYTHPKKNMLTKALGCEGDVEPSIYVKTFIKDDIVLMCSDGLTNLIKENEIYEIVKENPIKATDRLIAKANENGGLDNITVVIIF